MSNKFTNFFEEFKSIKKMNKKNYFNSYYKKAPGKENSDNFFDDPDINLNLLEQNSNLKKNRKVRNEKNFNVKEKSFGEKGQSKKFVLFNDKEIGLNTYHHKVNILEAEEDYDSDENVIEEGMRKVKNDLNDAIKKFKQYKFKDIINYGKYCKYGK